MAMAMIASLFVRESWQTNDSGAALEHAASSPGDARIASSGAAKMHVLKPAFICCGHDCFRVEVSCVSVCRTWTYPRYLLRRRAMQLLQLFPASRELLLS